MTVYPELVTGRLDGFERRQWRVERGSGVRGGASCNFTDRILTVPLGASAVERVVRAHELMHARISPHQPEHQPRPYDVSPRALECAEEFRVNEVLRRLGFDLDQLVDGSERFGAQRLGEANDWNEAVSFLLAVLGTGGEGPYFSGIRTHRREWVPGLRAIAKQARSLVSRESTGSIGSTVLSGEGVPEGYARVTVPLARLITSAMNATPPQTGDELRRFRRSFQPGARRAPTNQFATLVIGPTGDMDPSPRRAQTRRLRAATTGTALRYPQRLLTDPLQRGFSQRQRSRGGVILIDQSGSMDIGLEQLEKLLRVAPDAIVLGYSHRPGDQGLTPNAWVLADRGGVVRTPPIGNIGNGVDGPALEWALTLRHHGEPVVWVTDGQVTDSHDHPCDTLSRACAQLVQRERIRMVPSVEFVGECLRGKRWPPEQFGRVGRKLSTM